MMETWLSHLQHWHWWIAAVVLLILEVTTPAFFFLWLGIAAGITGLLLLFFPEMGWNAQFIWFSSMAMVSMAVWHLVLRKHPTVTRLPGLNRRGSQYIGRVLVVFDPIINGVGRARVDDSVWKVQGPDCPQGATVRVVSVEDATLHVELVGPPT